MRAWRVTSTERPDGIHLATDQPEPTEDLIVEIKAVGVGYPDLLMREGRFQIAQPVPFTLGWEASGIVVKSPLESSFHVGDRVATMSFGAWAERVGVNPETTFVIPDEMTFEQAAAFPLNYFTALAATRRGRLVPGETVLVHGGSGGVGSAAIQVCKAAGARVIAVVSSPKKAAFAASMGANHTVITSPTWRQDVEEFAPAGVDIVIDPVGGERFTDSIRVLAPEGRVVVIGFVGGSVPTVGVNRLLFNNVDICGCSWSVLANHAGGFAGASAELLGQVASGEIHPAVSTVPFENAPAALESLARRDAVGKLVLTL